MHKGTKPRAVFGKVLREGRTFRRPRVNCDNVLPSLDGKNLSADLKQKCARTKFFRGRERGRPGIFPVHVPSRAGGGRRAPSGAAGRSRYGFSPFSRPPLLRRAPFWARGGTDLFFGTCKDVPRAVPKRTRATRSSLVHRKLVRTVCVRSTVAAGKDRRETRTVSYGGGPATATVDTSSAIPHRFFPTATYRYPSSPKLVPQEFLTM